MIETQTWIGLFGGALITVIVTILFHLWLNRDNDPKIKIKEFSRRGSSNQKFYDELEKAARNAKNEIIQYAEGFDTDLPDRFDAAQLYVSKIKDILGTKPNISWLRYQTRNPVDEGWNSLINKVPELYPTSFKLLPVNNTDGDHIISIILIDPGTRFSKSFLLVSNPVQADSDKKIKLANASLMITGSMAFSEALRNQIELMYDRLK